MSSAPLIPLKRLLEKGIQVCVGAESFALQLDPAGNLPFRVISTPITPIFQSIGMTLQNFFISLLVPLGGALSGQDSVASWFFGLLLLPTPSQPLSR